MNHIKDQEFEAYLEGELEPARAQELESHTAVCEMCHTEMESWKFIFEGLSELPAFEPSAGFADKVMAQVSVPEYEPAWVKFWNRIEAYFPTTTRGWAMASILTAIPVLVLGGAGAWLLAQPEVTLGGVAMLVYAQVLLLGQTIFQSGVELLQNQGVYALGEQILTQIKGIDPVVAGGAGVGYLMLMLISMWTVYTNVVKGESIIKERVNENHKLGY